MALAILAPCSVELGLTDTARSTVACQALCPTGQPWDSGVTPNFVPEEAGGLGVLAPGWGGSVQHHSSFWPI